MEKTLRVLGGDEEGGGHSHSHSHSHTIEPAVGVNGSSTSVSVSGDASGLKSRGSDKADGKESLAREEDKTPSAQTSKLSAYLNLFGDFVHNM